MSCRAWKRERRTFALQVVCVCVCEKDVYVSRVITNIDEFSVENFFMNYARKLSTPLDNFFCRHYGNKILAIYTTCECVCVCVDLMRLVTVV